MISTNAANVQTGPYSSIGYCYERAVLELKEQKKQEYQKPEDKKINAMFKSFFGVCTDNIMLTDEEKSQKEYQRLIDIGAICRH